MGAIRGANESVLRLLCSQRSNGSLEYFPFSLMPFSCVNNTTSSDGCLGLNNNVKGAVKCDKH